MTVPSLRGLFATAAIALAAATCATRPAEPASANTQAPQNGATSRGAELYARHCAVCHGEDGDADTVVAQLLLPRPNAFRHGLFKLVSTTNGIPSDDDLVETLRRGMPGSTMMSWGWMADEDLRELAQEVRRLAVRGRAETIHAVAAATRQPVSFDAALATAVREFSAGPAVPEVRPVAMNEANAEAGERLYLQHCAACHGADGRGLPATAKWPTDGTSLWPRDFTAGYLRGDSTWRALAHRIVAGMPGAHMPPTRLSTPETASLVAYVKTLIPDGASGRHTQWRRTVRVPRVAALPASGDESAFAAFDRIRLPMAPLWWRADAVSEAWLTAAHDGGDLLLRLEWSDSTRDDTAKPSARIGDGVAIQFAALADPPLFAMGSDRAPVNVWRWQAYDSKELAGIVDLLSPSHQGLDVPLAAQPRPRAESIELHGIDTARSETGSGLPLDVVATWRDGRWTATFRRALRARGEREVDLAAPGPLWIAFAIWDARIDPHAGSKSITTWHAIELE